MHIGTGIYEGCEIIDPESYGPLSARALTIKEEVFTIIGVRVAESKVLDINDENGMYGIEALSRGAVVCRFVNPEKNEAELTSKNLKIIGLDSGDLVIKNKISDFIANPTESEFIKEQYDVIFFTVRSKNDFNDLLSILEKQKPSGVTAVIYPNNPDFVFPADTDGHKIMETREFDDKIAAILLKEKV